MGAANCIRERTLTSEWRNAPMGPVIAPLRVTVK